MARPESTRATGAMLWQVVATLEQWQLTDVIALDDQIRSDGRLQSSQSAKSRFGEVESPIWGRWRPHAIGHALPLVRNLYESLESLICTRDPPRLGDNEL